MADFAASDMEEGDAEPAPQSVVQNLQAIADYDGNLCELMNAQDLSRLGQETCRETEMDEKDRSEWLEGYQRALKATQQKPEKKSYPFEGASNIRYPMMTAACTQFNARAYSAITRSDQPVMARPLGSDDDGKKAKKADRLRQFTNYQLMHMCDEWDTGTDKLCMILPMGGSAFRKVYWDRNLARPVLDLATPDKIIVPSDAPSFERAPRITQPVPYYPYEVKRLIAAKLWADHRWQAGDNKSEDTQAPIEYYEQQRYIDLDGDGLQEPYIVTAHKESKTIVRIEPGFDIEGLKVNHNGDVETIVRESPLIPYYFLPSLDGSPYGMGFGQLLESLGGAVNTCLNQIFDAAHRQNAGGGFIAQGLRTRGGEMRIRPSEYKFINAPTGNLKDAIYDLQFPGPSPVLFQTMEFLLGASKDITAVKDVLTGDAPSGQAMGATLALIEQGLQVFSTIYVRIYRSERKELKRLMMLNRRYLDPHVYAEFLDDNSLLDELMQATGSPAAAMSALGSAPPGQMPAQMGAAPPQAASPPGMGAPSQAPPGLPPQPAPATPAGPAPKPEWTPETLKELMEDFNLKSMDVALGADPKSVTDMQRMARAEYLRGFLDPNVAAQTGVDGGEIARRMFEASGQDNIDKLFKQGPSPQDMVAAEQAKSQVAEIKSKTMLNVAKAEETRQSGLGKALERGITTGTMAGGVGGVEDATDGQGLPDLSEVDGGGLPTGMGEPAGSAPAGP